MLQQSNLPKHHNLILSLGLSPLHPPLKRRQFSWASRLICIFLLKRLFGNYSFQGNFFFFANWLKLGRDAALVFCDIFKTLVECLTYVAAGTPPLQKGCGAKSQAKLWRSAKTQGFPLFAKLQKYPEQALTTFCSFSLQSPPLPCVIKAC